MSLNPCLCGNFKSPEKLCTCNPYDINRNQKKVPFPLLDRIDIVLNLNQLQYDEYAFPSLAHSDAEKILSNSIYVDSFNQFAEHLLYTLQNDFAPSLRRLSKIKKLAQAIASVKFHTEVTEEDVLESINFNANILSINAFK
jgi:magnesium chelatase family protein